MPIIPAVRRPLSLLALLLFVASGCATTGKARQISGKILGKLAWESPAEAAPVLNARVQIGVARAVAKRPDTGPRFELPHGLDALTNLRGVAVTAGDGLYAFEALFTPWVDEDYPLLQGWEYNVEVVAPGYYIFTTSFVYEGQDPGLELVLERKPRDVVDDTGGVQENTYVIKPTTARRFE